MDQLTTDPNHGMIGLTTPSCWKRSIACLESSQRWCWFLGSQGAGVCWKKQEKTYARNGQVSSTNDWCVFSPWFPVSCFVCVFFGWKTPRSEFFGGLDKDLILKNTCKTQKWPKKVSEILVWGTLLVLFCTHGGVCFHVLNLVGVMCLYSAEWMTRLFLFEERQAFEPTSPCWYELMLRRCQTSKNLQDG